MSNKQIGWSMWETTEEPWLTLLKNDLHCLKNKEEVRDYFLATIKYDNPQAINRLMIAVKDAYPWYMDMLEKLLIMR